MRRRVETQRKRVASSFFDAGLGPPYTNHFVGWRLTSGSSSRGFSRGSTRSSMNIAAIYMIALAAGVAFAVSVTGHRWQPLGRNHGSRNHSHDKCAAFNTSTECASHDCEACLYGPSHIMLGCCKTRDQCCAGPEDGGHLCCGDEDGVPTQCCLSGWSSTPHCCRNSTTCCQSYFGNQNTCCGADASCCNSEYTASCCKKGESCCSGEPNHVSTCCAANTTCCTGEGGGSCCTEQEQCQQGSCVPRPITMTRSLSLRP